MIGKICMVTGSNSGIGKATALGLAKMKSRVVMVCRDKSKGESAMAEIKAKSGDQFVDLMLADLSSQESIRQLARDFTEKYQRLHVFVNNAGVYLVRHSLTIDGIEMTFAINHLAPFLLTSLLLGVLKAGAPSRIVNVTSSDHKWAKIDFGNLQGEKHYSGLRSYNQSKLANILFTYELAKRLGGTGVIANCVQPGVIRTNLGRYNNGVLGYIFKTAKFFARSPQRGADTVIYLASSPEVESISGKYFVKKAESKSSPESYDEGVSQRLWQVSAELAGIAR